MVRETSWLETEGTGRLPYHRQRLVGALPGREARPESLLLQHRELRSSRCGRETQSRRPHAATRRPACVFCRSGRHRMSGRECVIEGIKKQELRSKNGAQGTRDIEGKAAREAASELGSERVSMERTGMRDIEGSEPDWR